MLIPSPWGMITRGEGAAKLGIHILSMGYRVKNWPQDRWFDPPKTATEAHQQ